MTTRERGSGPLSRWCVEPPRAQGGRPGYRRAGAAGQAVARAIQEGTPGGPIGLPAPHGAVNAAAIPETLLESELFGHVRGAFTGAAETRAGRIRAVDGGCFFLDEVGDLSPTTQAKLLRVMETDEVSPLGADVAYHVDVRWVAATHRDLAAMVEGERFRRDLYQRLAGNVIRTPPLRERPEDIVDIGLAFVDRQLPPEGLAEERRRIGRWLRSAEARRQPFRGNVRELQNVLRDLLLGLEPTFAESPVARAAPAAGDALPPAIRDSRATLREVEDWYLARVLGAAGDNQAEAARVLGIDRATVRRRLRARTS